MVRLAEDQAGPPRHRLLHERGDTTVATVRRIADALGPPDAVMGYCGLMAADGAPSS
ncbi:hypothetical protein [Streptomyces avicenniae]|uniref:hypothetical protein n=1 Tax=Streptomyces avicenniae TaxID=500153 RepID=UPI000B0FF565|nr:hypothetical protein [Streptomyces avicenniae]